MILVISEVLDITSNEVGEWLKLWKIPFFRIDKEDIITINHLSINEPDFIITINNCNTITFSDIKVVWYRSGGFNFNLCNKKDIENENINGIIDFLNLEMNVLNRHFLNLLNKKIVLGNYFNSIVNKLDNLVIAKKCEFEIPNTCITSFKNEVIDFLNNNSSITKPIGESMPISDKDYVYQIFTKEININDINRIEDIFTPSLFQEKIDKWIELRVFVLNKSFFSMAIFSQNDEKTKTDFRNYNNKKMNRMVPFDLPKKEKEKILKFMHIAHIDTGSFDLLIDKNSNYIFLEVNPAGNIDMVSKHCNYPIEKEISEYLKRKYYE